MTNGHGTWKRPAFAAFEKVRAGEADGVEGLDREGLASGVRCHRET